MTHMKTLIAAAAVLALVACKGDKTARANETAATTTPVTAPTNGDWGQTYSATDAGGFLMGNPNAKVRLVEYGSLTCPHCREFDETGVKPLVDNYVKKGLVGYEFRNFVRDPYDITASIVARCGGAASFWGLTRSFYASQPEWIAKIQQADPTKLQQIGALPVAQQYAALAEIGGFPEFAAQRGLPREKVAACLSDPNTPTQLVQMQTDAVTQYDVPGTPSFILNGKMVEIKAGTPVWDQLDAALKTALDG